MASFDKQTGRMVATIQLKTPQVKDAFQGRNVSMLITIHSHNITAFLCLDDSKIGICENGTNGKLLRAFQGHVNPSSAKKKDIISLVHLKDDVLCSMDSGGNIITWIASSGKVLDRILVLGVEAWSFGKTKRRPARSCVEPKSDLHPGTHKWAPPEPYGRDV